MRSLFLRITPLTPSEVISEMSSVLGGDPISSPLACVPCVGLSPRQHFGLHLNADELLIIITRDVEDFVVEYTKRILMRHVPLPSSFFFSGSVRDTT